MDRVTIFVAAAAHLSPRRMGAETITMKRSNQGVRVRYRRLVRGALAVFLFSALPLRAAPAAVLCVEADGRVSVEGTGEACCLPAAGSPGAAAVLETRPTQGVAKACAACRDVVLHVSAARPSAPNFSREVNTVVVHGHGAALAPPRPLGQPPLGTHPNCAVGPARPPLGAVVLLI